MAHDPADRTTVLLKRMSAGDAEAEGELYEHLYGDLQRRARAMMRAQGPEHTLQSTALVNEAWLKLSALADPDWQDRTHFVRVAARAMRCVLVDHARAKQTARRDGGVRRTLGEHIADGERSAWKVLALDEALERLEKSEPQPFRVAELRIFGGLSHAEIATALEVSTRTVERAWSSARAWLLRELEADQE
ncbi:MAG: ECF-type sigma factor [Planctomycetota bacterium]|jgi:RNA polymerase sigma factor (TIGR02999 family)|nr:ECF-type sigma factor [Planctomycetota bacterium]MDP6764249.1 ECF-type sigma factor [Planctomycetota bacterium]MDP6990407.1 ECF-type sigma factor [Planctomycetota bacterium]